MTVESPHQETKNDPHAVGVLRSKTVGSCDVDEVSGSGTASSDERSGLEMDWEEERGSWELLASLTDHAQANPRGVEVAGIYCGTGPEMYFHFIQEM